RSPSPFNRERAPRGDGLTLWHNIVSALPWRGSAIRRWTTAVRCRLARRKRHLSQNVLLQARHWLGFAHDKDHPDRRHCPPRLLTGARADLSGMASARR